MKKIPEAPQTLMDQALALARSLTTDELREKTGIPSCWLRKFRQGAIPNPGVKRIEKILTAFGVATVTLPRA